jgi:hypothetical protein
MHCPAPTPPYERGKSAQQQVQQAHDPELAAILDEIVAKAAKDAKTTLLEKVATRAQALALAPGETKSYHVLEHKGWYIVAYYGGGAEPMLWFNGVAIRKNSREVYTFGSW